MTQIKVSDFALGRNRAAIVGIGYLDQTKLNAEIELLVGHSCESCEQARALWTAIAAEFDLTLRVRKLDSTHPESPPVNALPLLKVDGRALVVGVPTADEARRLLRDALQRTRDK